MEGVRSIEKPLKVAVLLADFERPWFIAGGWAIDLCLGRMTRAHKDIEIAILRDDQHAIRKHLTGWEFRKVLPRTGGRMEPWHEGEWLAMPVHEIHAHSESGDPSALEILLDESSEEQWRFRRSLEVTRPLSMIGMRSDEGVPFLSPEIVLLYKATSLRIQDHDRADFENARPFLGGERLHWLRQAIERYRPGHPWLADL